MCNRLQKPNDARQLFIITSQGIEIAAQFISWALLKKTWKKILGIILGITGLLTGIWEIFQNWISRRAN